MTSDQATEQHVLYVVRRQILAAVPDIDAQDLVLDARMADLGVDSLARMDVIVGALEELRLSTPAHRLATARNIGELVQMLCEEGRT